MTPASFSRRGEPVLVPVGIEPNQVDIKTGRPPDARRFFFTNPNPFYVRFKGSSMAVQLGFQPATSETGWLLPPHSTSEIFRTQLPDWGSTLPVSKADIPVPMKPDGSLAYAEPIELTYGV